MVIMTLNFDLLTQNPYPLLLYLYFKYGVSFISYVYLVAYRVTTKCGQTD